jgi:adhesin transport system outer membrane protein
MTFFKSSLAILLSTVCLTQVAKAEVFSIRDAIKQTITTNPGVSEAAANRRATESEMRQVQSTLLPQVRLESRIGKERFDSNNIPAVTGSGIWRDSQEYSAVLRQIVFDGFATINEIWRQAARTDAAAMRTYERTELLALDASEAYLDVVRYIRLVELATRNLRAHQEILRNVDQRYAGGRAGEGDLQQTRERVAAAEAALAGFLQNLDEARARFRKVVGLEPVNLRWPGRLPDLPASKDATLSVAIRYNPTIRAAQADADAAKYGYRATAGAFVPNVALEGRATTGRNYNNFIGDRDELSGKVVFSWDVFRGGQDLWRRNEMAERYIETTQRHARLQRDALESIDKAWSVRIYSGSRIAALTRQVAADRRTIDAYTKEYELGQRSLIDLLNAQNQLFSASVSLVSTQSLAIFSDFQMLAAMGHLLAYLNEPHSIDAEPLTLPFGFVPLKLAPVRILDPDIKSELLPAKATIVEPSLAPSEHPTPVSPKVKFGRPEDAIFYAPYWTFNLTWTTAQAFMDKGANAMATDADIPASREERMNFAPADNRPSWLPKQVAGKK